ncbi:MAG: molybdopterin molybdenumtransferase MoeA, partial [Planctomycetaceae bacterium]|nr:molybdopterin molybdenumtransferase MoeA [Planctomycetaceae bacterium]
PRTPAPGSTLVFGLPGNPVSTLVCFELFAKTAIGAMLGTANPRPRSLPAILSVAFENRGDRPTYHPARIAFGNDGRLTVTPVRWAGSGDLKATVEANGVAVFEAGRSFAACDVIGALLWSGCDIDAT